MHHEVSIQQLSNFLLEYATTLMAVGAHTSRVVRNVSRIAESFDYAVDMTIFQKNITMSVIHRKDDCVRRTSVRKIKHLALNFRIISHLSTLSWNAYDNRLPLYELQHEYDRIMAEPRISRWAVLFLVACANASFCRLFSGDPMAMALVFGATLVAFFIRQEMMNRHINHMVVFMVCSFVSSLVAAMGLRYFETATPEIALGTSVLFLIPGVPLINSIIDILEGHVLTGFSRSINACILIICIALGLATTLSILGLDTL